MVYEYLVFGVAAFIVLLALLAAVFMQGDARKEFKTPDQLQTLGIALAVLGIVFGADPVIGYSFIAAGVVLSIASLAVRRR